MKHLTLFGLVRMDLFDRAVPWTEIMLERKVFQNDLNTRWHHVLSVPLSLAILATVALPHPFGWLWVPLALLFLVLHRHFLGFVGKERGWWFGMRAAAFSWFGYLYSAVGAALGVARFARGKWTRKPAAAPEATAPVRFSSGD
jgi:hypothetical protein